MVAMLEYRDIDGDSVPVLKAFKHGLEEESLDDFNSKILFMTIPSFFNCEMLIIF